VTALVFAMAASVEAGSGLTDRAEVVLAIPSAETPRIQEIHLMLGHFLYEAVGRNCRSRRSFDVGIARLLYDYDTPRLPKGPGFPTWPLPRQQPSNPSPAEMYLDPTQDRAAALETTIPVNTTPHEHPCRPPSPRRTAGPV